MFVAAGQPGNVKKIQASVATARKVFRIMRVRRLALRGRDRAWLCGTRLLAGCEGWDRAWEKEACCGCAEVVHTARCACTST